MAYALRSYEFFLLHYRRAWTYTVASSFFNPVFLLGSLGLGLGQLVGGGGTSTDEFVQFVAPGLLAAAAMQVAAAESSNPVVSNFLWQRNYVSMHAAPLDAGDILAGQQFFVATRVLVSAAFYLAVSAAVGAVQSPLGLLAIPAAALVGLAFSAPVAAFAGRSDDNDWVPTMERFVIMPMFLFAGVFYSVTELPAFARWLAYASPLWHGVELCRDLMLGDVEVAADLGHVGYLLAWSAVGLWLALGTHQRRLQR